MMPKIVDDISKDFLDVLEKYFPGISKKKFDNFGHQDPAGSDAFQRMRFCVFIELLKAGLLQDYL